MYSLSYGLTHLGSFITQELTSHGTSRLNCRNLNNNRRYALYIRPWGHDSSVVIASRYGLDGPGIESLSVGGARFSAPVQTCPGAHPASCTMGTGSFPGGKAAGAWCWPPTPGLASGLWKGRAIPLLALRDFVACYGVDFTFIWDYICTARKSKNRPLSLRHLIRTTSVDYSTSYSGVKQLNPVHYTHFSEYGVLPPPLTCFHDVIFN